MEKKILVVDDEAPIRELLNIFLKHRGYDVLGVATPEEAIEAVSNTNFDLIILDINLHGKNGLDLIKPLKEMNTETPIVILTGLGRDEKLMERAFSEGAVGYIVKTDPLNEMLTAIRQHLK